MKRSSLLHFLLTMFFLGISVLLDAQCVMCTKTAANLDDESAKGLNDGIIYLAFMPLSLILFIGYRWWQSMKKAN